MTTLTKQARDTIKAHLVTCYWMGLIAYKDATIAGYVRHWYGAAGWGGDRCGCVDDRCIGFHHNDDTDCQCLQAWIDDYVKELRGGAS